MTFLQRLSQFLNRSVEVFMANQIVIGELISVSLGGFTVRVGTSYYGPEDITIFQSEVAYVKILPLT